MCELTFTNNLRLIKAIVLRKGHIQEVASAIFPSEYSEYVYKITLFNVHHV